MSGELMTQAEHELYQKIKAEAIREAHDAKLNSLPLVEADSIKEFMPFVGEGAMKITKRQVSDIMRHSVAVEHRHDATTYACRTDEHLVTMIYGQRQTHGYLRIDPLNEVILA